MNKAKLKRIIKEELTKMLSEEQRGTKLQLDQGEYTIISNVGRIDDPYNPGAVSHILDPAGKVVLHLHSYDTTDGVGPASEYKDPITGKLLYTSEWGGSLKKQVQSALDALIKQG